MFKMILLRILLFPIACIYDLVTRIRNHLYDQGLKPSVKFDIPVVAVGNLTVGGTGKTPMIEHLIRLLQNEYKVATLSRGYGRKTKGIRIAKTSESASTIGDEPFQFYTKFGNRITVGVGEERALAIPTILQEHPEINVILLDDAFQHRKVSPSLSILLSDYNGPFYRDYVLPTGRLRESRQGAKRADAVVVTKCPVDISDDEMMVIENSIKKYTAKPLFFTCIRYGNPVPFAGTQTSLTQNVVLISGIANSKPLEDYVRQNFVMIKHLKFQDHHVYTDSDFRVLLNYMTSNTTLSFLTTEKDKVKLDVSEFQKLTNKLPLFYLPIEVEFIKSGKDFDEIVLNIVKRDQ